MKQVHAGNIDTDWRIASSATGGSTGAGHGMKRDQEAVSGTLSVAVVIASLGRPDLLAQMRGLMDAQTRLPDMLLFSVVSEKDVPEGFAQDDQCRVIMGDKGLCAQRNNALNFLAGRYDIVLFYDDDFIPARTSVEGVERFFRTHPEVVGATGNVVADGINNAGISFAQAQSILDKHPSKDATPNCIVASLKGLYGCNMAYRVSAIGTTRFDERLKLYAWQEDIDFAASLQGRGRIVKTFAFAGVHQGVKHGRTPGKRLGYSQIINPSYLACKGTMRRGFAAKLILRNMMANHIKVLKPEPWVDRWGRVKGNWIGVADLLRGRLTPERIETL
jgi:hypothetical protein